MPTEVIFGQGCIDQVGKLVHKYGGSRVMVVYGGGSAVRSGLLDRVCSALESEGLWCCRFGGVQPNPRLKKAREGVKQAMAAHIDFLLPVGGGSVIDTAKAIAHGIAHPGTDIWQFWLRRATLSGTTPVGAILTIPAAGSETSDSAVLTDTDSGLKCGLTSELNRPVFTLMDPTLAATLPPYQIGCGVADIMMHTLDRFFNANQDNELSDALAEALLRTVIAQGSAVIKNPSDYHAMSEIMWAGSISHNGLTGLGGSKDFSPHQLGHELSARYDAAHGASLTAVWGAWARYVLPESTTRFARYARNVWGISAEDDTALALAGIEATEAYFRSLGMPTSLRELGITPSDAELNLLADGCSRGGTRIVGSMRPIDRDDMHEIYRLAT